MDVLKITKLATGGPLPDRAGHAVVAVDRGAPLPQVYVIGGSNTGVLDVQLLDDTHQKWTAVATSFRDQGDAEDPTKFERTNHSATAVGTSVYVLGGKDSEGRILGDLLVLDTETAEWTIASPEGEGPGPRHSHTATAIGSLIYLFGGKSESGIHNDVFILDPSIPRWIKPAVTGLSPSPRYAHTAVELSGKVYVYGGFKDYPVGDLWALEVGSPAVRGDAEVDGDNNLLANVTWSKVSVRNRFDPPLPIVICGPSGVGKGTLINKLMAEFKDRCGFSVSHTTRAPREGEVDGVHYHFTNRAAMEADVADGKFLEHADVHGNMYGTSIAAVQSVTDAGKVCILDIDVQGALQVKLSPLRALFIFVRPPSFDELERRLRGRGTEKEAAIEKRLANARAEMERSRDMELFDYVMVNDDLDKAYQQLKVLADLSADSSSGDHCDEPLLDPPAPAPAPRHRHVAALVGGHSLVIHGGSNGRGDCLGDWYVLKNLTTAQAGAVGKAMWVPAKVKLVDGDDDSPKAMQGHAGLILGDEALTLICGGSTAEGMVENTFGISL